MNCNHQKVMLIAYIKNGKNKEPYKMFTCKKCKATLLSENGTKPRIMPTAFWKNL